MHQKNNSLLCQHLKFYHGLYPGAKLNLKCGEHGRHSSFCTYNGFKKHLSSVHKHMDQYKDVNHNVTIQGLHESIVQPQCSTTVTSSVHSVHHSHSIVGRSQLSSMCGSIVASLQASGIPEGTVQTIVCSREEVVCDIHSQACEEVIKTLSHERENTGLTNKVEHCFSQLDNPFSVLNTVTKRHNYCDEKWELAEPVAGFLLKCYTYKKVLT